MEHGGRQKSLSYPLVRFLVLLFSILSINVHGSPIPDTDLARRAPVTDFSNLMFVTETKEEDGDTLAVPDAEDYQFLHAEAKLVEDKSSAAKASGIVRVWGPVDADKDSVWVKEIYPALLKRLQKGYVMEIWYMEGGATAPDQTAYRKTKKTGRKRYHRLPPKNHGEIGGEYIEAWDGRWWKEGIYYNHNPATGAVTEARIQLEGRDNRFNNHDAAPEPAAAGVPKAPVGKPAAPKAPGMPSAPNGKPLHNPRIPSWLRPPSTGE